MARVITNKGSILITTLWIVSILAVMAVGIGFRVSVETRLSKYYAESQKALYLAKAGVIKSQYLLSSSKKDYDYVYECGIDYSEDNNPEQIFGYDMNIMESGSFSVYYELFPDSDEPLKVYGVADEERKININADKLAKGNIGEYRRMLSVLDADITEDIIDAIIDWQDTDETTTGFGGAESFYYESLPKPYSSKNEDYEIIHELLLVKGVSRELYEKLKNYLTVYGDGKVNINTASMKVVNAVIGDGKGTYGGLLNSIAEYKAGADGILGRLMTGFS